MTCTAMDEESLDKEQEDPSRRTITTSHTTRTVTTKTTTTKTTHTKTMTVTLKSINKKYSSREFPGIRIISMKIVRKKESSGVCALKKSFGFYRTEAWVSQGCSATFKLTFTGTLKKLAKKMKVYSLTTRADKFLKKLMKSKKEALIKWMESTVKSIDMAGRTGSSVNNGLETELKSILTEIQKNGNLGTNAATDIMKVLNFAKKKGGVLARKLIVFEKLIGKDCKLVG